MSEKQTATAVHAPADAPSESRNGRRSAPRLRGGLLLGNVRELQRNPLQLFTKAFQEHGDLSRIRVLPTLNQYLVVNPYDVEHILYKNQQNYRKGDAFAKPFGALLGSSVLVSEGELWRRQRRLTQPAFHRQRLARLVEKITAATNEMIRDWQARVEEGGPPLDIPAEMVRLTFRIASETLFSLDLSHEADETGLAIKGALEHVRYLLMQPAAPPLWLPTAANRRFKRHREVINRAVYGIIKQRRLDEDKGDLLSMLLLARDEETGEGMNDEQLRDEVMTFLVGGFETAATALGWTWYLLHRHPAALESLRKELASVLGGRTPTFKDLPQLAFTRMVFEETMRLYPPAWTIQREPIRDDEIRGYRIPAGASVFLCQYLTHRHPDFWERPDEFIPERFSPERSAGRPRFAYYPFGGGGRQCIGNNFALMEAQLIIAIICQHFSLSPVPGHEVEAEPGFTLRPRYGLPMKVASVSRAAG